MALTLGVSIGNAKWIGANGQNNYWNGSTMESQSNKPTPFPPSGNYAYTSYGSFSKGNGNQLVYLNSDSRPSSFEIASSGMEILVALWGNDAWNSLLTDRGTITIDMKNSYLKFEDGGQPNDHFLGARNQGGNIQATFAGGSGSETINGITYNNLAFYGGVILETTNSGKSDFNFSSGASVLGMLKAKNSNNANDGSGYVNADYTFTGGGNIFAITKDSYTGWGEANNIKDQAIVIDTGVGNSTSITTTINISFGTSGKQEYAESGLLDKDGVLVNKITNFTNQVVTKTSETSDTAGKILITNAIKGNITVNGWKNVNSILNLNFYNNGLIEGAINMSSIATINVYFANEGIIRSDLDFALGGDGSRGNGLVIKKSTDDDTVDKLTFDGSITTPTVFSAKAKNLVLIGHKDNDDNMTTKNTINVNASSGSLTLTATEQANIHIGKIQNSGGTLQLNLSGGLNTQLTENNKKEISFTSNNITTQGGNTTLAFALNNSSAPQKLAFNSGDITNSGTFSLSLTTNNASSTATFNTSDISNSGTMNLNFSSTTAPLTFTAGAISNSGTFAFTPSNTGSLTLTAKGIRTTGNSGSATTTFSLDSQADFATGYIATTSVGATDATLNTTLTATAANGKNLVLSAINLSSNAETLTLSGVGEEIGIIKGIGRYVLFAGKSNMKQEIQLNFNNTQNSHALVLGDIYTYTGTNTLILKDTANADTKLDFIGNIQSRGNTNIYFENTLWAPTNISEMLSPSSYALDPSQTTAITNILKYVNTYGTGKVTTTGGTTNLIVNTSSINLGNTPAMYQVDSSAGGNINIAIKGATNIGAGIKYSTNTNQAVNLTFAATTTGSFNSAGSTNIANNQFFDVVYQDGVKLTLQDYQISNLDNSTTSFLAKAREALGIDSSLNDMSFVTKRSSSSITTKAGTAYTDTIILDGITVGTIQPLAKSTSGSNDTYTFNVTLTKNSFFAGNIDLHGANKSIELTMQQGSKIFAHNNRLVISKLTLDSGTQHDSTTLLQNSFAQQNTTIDLATNGNDFANIASRDTFNLLAIGDTTQTDTNTTGLHGNNALFRVYVNPTAISGKLGDQEEGMTGKTGADRVVVLSGTSGKHYIQAIYDANANVSNITYHGGGTEVEGNIAVATVKTATGITMEGARQIQGFDLIETALQDIKTDVTGNGNSGSGDYTTYFLKSVVSTGASPVNADTTTSAMGLNYDLFLANFNSLNKRMGELRNNDHSQGAWGRIFNGMLTTSYGLETKSIYTTVQAGYDYAFGFEGANNYLGVALSYANSLSDSKKMLDYDGVEKGIDSSTTHGVEVAVYNSYVEDSGWFNDTIFKFSYMMSSLKIAGQSSNYDTNNFGIVLSDEFGYRFKLGSEKEWYIDPQVEVGFGYFNQSNLKQVLGEASLDGVQDAIMTLRTRAGVNWAYDFKRFTQGKGVNASVYIGTYYSYDYINGGEISLTTNLGKNTNLTPLASTGRFELNVGTNIEVKNNTRIYFDFEKSFAGKITTDYQVNVGVRYSFGENTGYTPLDPNKKSITPLKVSDENAQESEESVENTQGDSNTQEQTSTDSKDNKTEESTEVKSEEKAQ